MALHYKGRGGKHYLPRDILAVICACGLADAVDFRNVATRVIERINPCGACGRPVYLVTRA